MIPGLTEQAWEKVFGVLKIAFRDAHPRTVEEDALAAWDATRAILEDCYRQETKDRVDSVRIIADELEKHLHTHYDQWAGDHVEPFDEYGLSLHGLAWVAGDAIKSIRTIIDPEPDYLRISPADMKVLMNSMILDRARHLRNADMTVILKCLYNRLPAIVSSKPADLDISDHFANVGAKVVALFLDQKEIPGA